MAAIATRPLVSIVIPTFRRPDKLVALLKSIGKSDYPADCLEVIVVDNAADPKLEPVITAVLPRLTLLVPGENLYSQGARELGAERADGQYVFFLDDDNTIAPDCLSRLIDALEGNPRLGVVAPVMLHGDTDEIWCAGGRITSLGLAAYPHQGQPLRAGTLPELIEQVDYFPNAFMVRRESLLAAPLDSASFPHNWAETDFALRIARAGYGLACVTSAIDRHHVGYSGPLARLLPETVYDQARSRLVFRKRHFGRTADWLLFWGIIFPVSSVAYFAQMARSRSGTWPLLRSYARGTIDGVFAPGSPAREKIRGAA